MNSIHITISNWQRHQPTSDKVRHPHWFKVHNSIATSESLFSLSAAQKWIWVCILAECSRKKSDSITLNLDYASRHFDVPKKVILETIEILTQNQTLTINCQSTDGSLTLEENREEEKRIEKKRAATSGAEAPVIAEFPTISQKLFDSWLQTYQDQAWINLEIKKAHAWIHANPRKAPKTDFARFLNNWLSRGWENYRKTIKQEKKNTWLESYEAKIQRGEIVNGP